MTPWTPDRAHGLALEAEGQAILEALKRADQLCAYIVEHAMAEELSTHVEISFEPEHAAMIANLAEAYRAKRAGEARHGD